MTSLKKEQFHYYCAFFAFSCVAKPIMAYLIKKPTYVLMLVPMTFSFVFQYDLFYGNMQVRAQKEAERLIREEPERFFLPEGNGILSNSEYKKIMGLDDLKKR